MLQLGDAPKVCNLKAITATLTAMGLRTYIEPVTEFFILRDIDEAFITASVAAKHLMSAGMPATLALQVKALLTSGSMEPLSPPPLVRGVSF